MKIKLFFLVVLSLLTKVNTFAFDCEVDGIYYNRLSTDELEVTKGTNKYTGDLIIPETVTYRDKVFKVVQIGNDAFSHCTSLTSVSIPQGVKSLPSFCFQNCTNLIKITIPQSITAIGASAFRECKALSSLDLPNGISAIENYLFYGCSKLSSVSIPQEVISIGISAFEGCSSLTSLVLPNKISKIDKTAFLNCTSLTSISMPDSLTSLGESAFEGCSSLSTITMPDKATIANAAFKNCKNLTSIELPTKLFSIGYNAFEGCTSLASVNLPESLSLICDKAFLNCSNLITVFVPKNVQRIGTDAFSKCTGLKKVIIGDITSWCNIFFQTAESNPLYYAQHLYSDEETEIKKLYIGRDVYRINNFCFNKAENLTSIYILGDTPPTVEANTFSNTCYTWTDVYVPVGTKEKYQSADYWKNFMSLSEVDYTADYDGLRYRVISASGAEVIYNKDGNLSGEITIPESITINNNMYRVTAIGMSAFSRCKDITTVHIPKSVTKIEHAAFFYCSSLTSINIPDNVTEIDHEAFFECTSLATVDFGNKLETIGDLAFSHCNAITLINFPNSLKVIGGQAFQDCTNIKSLNFSNNLSIIGYSAFGNCTGLNSIYIPAGVNSITNNTINASAFIGCSGLTSIIVSEDNKIFDSRDNCNAIIETATNTLLVGCKNTIIPNGVTTIGNYAFTGCTELTSIFIPGSVTGIDHYYLSGSYAFSGCTNLTSIVVSKDNRIYDSRDNCNAIIETATNTLIAGCKSTIIPNTVSSIGNNAFFNLTSLVSITIPNSVTSIGDYAFRNCTSLTAISFPSSVTSIGRYAFCNCSGLISVTIPSTITTIGDGAFESCKRLTTITSLNPIPPTIGKDTFYNVYATLKVPAGSKTAYQNAEYWKNFTNIVEIDPSGIKSITLDKEINASTYDLNGRKLKEPSKGINIIGGKKVVVK